MATDHECLCGCEIDSVKEKMDENSNEMSCITEHEGFHSVCLDVWVLHTAHFGCGIRYGDTEERSVHE